MAFESELQQSVQGSLLLSDSQRQRAAHGLETWVRSRATVPDTDERLWGLLHLIPTFVGQLKLRLDSHGLAVEPVAGRLAAVPLLLSRGASWLRGGEWESIVMACACNHARPENGAVVRKT